MQLIPHSHQIETTHEGGRNEHKDHEQKNEILKTDKYVIMRQPIAQSHTNFTAMESQAECYF